MRRFYIMSKLNNFSLSLATATMLASFFIFCFPFSVSAATSVSGPMTQDTTWTQAQSPYVVQSTISVAQGVTLTIEPGVIVKFNFFAGLSVDGALVVDGTATSRVYFTSYNDDSAGGDTNGDGAATSPLAQDWREIRFNAGSTGTITHATVRYGGRMCGGCSQSGLFNNGGTVTIFDSQFSQNNATGISQTNGFLSITNSEIDHQTNGFFLGFGTTATISNSNFHNNSYGVTTSSGGSLTLINNTFADNSTGAASVDGLIHFTHSGNTAFGAGRKGFAISNRIASDTQWNNDLPYIIDLSLTIDAGKTLTIDPGVIVKYGNINSSFYVDGTLNVNGTKEAPVFLTSIKDDTAGGDTNGDGSTTVPVHGDWMHLQFNTGSTGNLTHAIVMYAGGFNEVFQGGSFSGVYNKGGNVTISHSEIAHNGSYFYFTGIRQDSGNLTISDSSIHDNRDGVSNYSLGSPMQAINNWWGDATGPYHGLLNPQGHGVHVSDNVNFIPWLGYDPTKNQPPTLSGLRQYKSDGAIDISEGAITTQHTVIFKATLNDLDADQVKLQIELRRIEESFTGTDDGGILTSVFASSSNQAVITKTDIIAGAYKWRARVIDDKGAMSAWQEFGVAGNGDFEIKQGNSSVAFLPGFEGSRLYTPGTLFENRLWEPNRNDDVRKLYFNPDGTPQFSDVYTRDDIDQVYGALNNIYVGFNDSMKKLVDDKMINEFEILPYDWRFPLDDILTSGKVVGMDGVHANLSYTQATSSPYIIQEIERLARNSATGKTTIIAHSNGGLLAKRLMKKLEEKGEANIIDKIIFVAVPQSGTAQAVAALLHGHDQAFGFGFVLTQSNARTFGENMPAGYNLLPHQKYFTDVSTPVLTFDPFSSLTQTFRNAYGAVISNRNELYQFLTGADGRSKPAPEDTDNPNILNRTLLDRSLAIQDALDTWTPPQGVEVIQIAGWGIPKTLGAINYTEKDNLTCLSLSGCPPKLLDYKPEFVVDGDGTVVIPSALAMGTSTAKSYYVNLKKYNDEVVFGFRNRNHKDILEVIPLQEFIKNLVQNKNDLTRHISTTPPIALSTDKRLVFSVHSPVSIDLYDSFGEHTGLSTTTLPEHDVQIIDEQIPNSYYMEFGEGKYVGADELGTTTVKLIGQSLGTFTLNVSEAVGNAVVASTTFAGIPTATSSVFILSSQSLSQPPMLIADIDGDGTPETTITSGDGVSPQEFIAILKGIVKTLDMPVKKKDALLKKIDKLQKAIEKDYKNERNKKRKIGKAFGDLVEKIIKFQKNGVLAQDEASELLDIIVFSNP